MFESIARTLGQLADPRLRGVLAAAILATLVLILALAAVVGAGIDALQATGIGWLDELFTWLGAIATVILAFLFFPGMVQVISGLFADRVAEAVEARHYTALGPARHQTIGEILTDALQFAAVSVGLNLLALPFYLLLPGLNLALFYGLNGYLLGREYAEMVAVRRLDRAGVKAFRKQNQGALFAAGVAIAVLATIPVVNLATPVLATAFALHEFERLRRRNGGEPEIRAPAH
ncbi:MAG: EI24 domain-containing protein [Thalassobaculum sp.]|uniref:EI24 domain-containing protein n=1 Tax=Thalassobaculum sp. TaxID=2022740 RepID=UPI0032EDA9CD